MSWGFRAVAALITLTCLSGCGGGGGGGGGDDGPNYSISVSPTSVSLSGITSGPTQTQNVTVTFRGDGVVVGTRPGEALPNWLTANAPGVAGSPVVVTISATPVNTGALQATLRFATGRADGSNVVFTDVPINFQVVEGIRTRLKVSGLARGNSVAVRQNTSDAATVNENDTTLLPAVAVATPHTITVSAQPTGQICTFDDGGTTTTRTVVQPFFGVDLFCHASLVAWSWMGGSKAVDVAPVYGTKGTPAAGQGPGGRAHAATALDAAGNLWLFGGSDINGFHNDLWKFDTSAQTWTWISGSTAVNATGVYGTQGTPGTDNFPGARTKSTAWIDADGNFWVFGGFGFNGPGSTFASLNDLWVFDVAGGSWTWVGGANTPDPLGVYGITPSQDNIPGSRFDATAIKDAGGKIWWFGGSGNGELNSFGRMNDLWTFEPNTRVWTWLKGDNHPSHVGVYGTRLVPDIANTPRARSGVALSFDAAGKLWLFGGTDANGYNNDLWRYDPATNMWTWISGANSSDPLVPRSAGNYQPPGTTLANMPAARELATAWRDANDNLWIFGGDGLEGQTTLAFTGTRFARHNDLWKYQPGADVWTWVGGSSAGGPSVFGTHGVADPMNVPSGRLGNAAWVDASGAFWLYGGTDSSNSDQRFADFWRLPQ